MYVSPTSKRYVSPCLNVYIGVRRFYLFNSYFILCVHKHLQEKLKEIIHATKYSDNLPYEMNPSLESVIVNRFWFKAHIYY